MSAGVTVRANTDGTLDYLDNASRIIFTVDPINRKLIMADGAIFDATAATSILSLASGSILTAHIAANAVTAAKLTTTMAKPTIPLSLFGARLVSANDVANIAASGGVLAKNTDPILERVNGATDKAIRIKWAATSVIEIMFDPITIPIDMDTTQPLVVNLKAFMSGASDTPVIAVGYWPGVGGSNGGGNTGALSSTEAQKTVSVAAPGTYPSEAVVTLTPGAHGTDALYLVGAWAEYTLK